MTLCFLTEPHVQTTHYTKIKSLVSEKSSYFSDYYSKILGPKYMFHLDGMNKKVVVSTKVWLSHLGQEN